MDCIVRNFSRFLFDWFDFIFLLFSLSAYTSVFLMYAGRYALFSVISVQFESVLHQSEEVCSCVFKQV